MAFATSRHTRKKLVYTASVSSLFLFFLLNMQQSYLSHSGTSRNGGNNGTIKHHRGHPETKFLPQCIVIGVRKGGTRALIDMIDLHSKVNHQ